LVPIGWSLRFLCELHSLHCVRCIGWKLHLSDRCEQVLCCVGNTSMPVDRLTSRMSWRDLQSGAQNVRTMSCSDKIMCWNVLGLQGSLLSQYLEPVYLSSITIGLCAPS